jgi:hypothetical protein
VEFMAHNPLRYRVSTSVTPSVTKNDAEPKFLTTSALYSSIWPISDQKQRCMASALLDIEPRLQRIKGHRHLRGLQRALAAELKGMPSAPAAQVAA